MVQIKHLSFLKSYQFSGISCRDGKKRRGFCVCVIEKRSCLSPSLDELFGRNSSLTHILKLLGRVVNKSINDLKYVLVYFWISLSTSTGYVVETHVSRWDVFHEDRLYSTKNENRLCRVVVPVFRRFDSDLKSRRNWDWVEPVRKHTSRPLNSRIGVFHQDKALGIESWLF